MNRSRPSVFASMSARVGSISDNRLGGWYAYRASKAAHNMIIKTLAIESARSNPQCVVAGLHPGTVDTPPGGMAWIWQTTSSRKSSTTSS